MRRTHDYTGKKALVLNADFSALSLISAREGLIDSFKNQYNPEQGLQPIDFFKDLKVLAGHGRYFPIPVVLRKPVYLRPKGVKVKYSRKNVFLRDNMTCMYCGHKDITCKSLNLDHVIPRAIWKRQNHTKTPTDWLNIVTACISCNRKKRNRTPSQASMVLKMEPYEPNAHNHIRNFSPWTYIEPEWVVYLPKNYQNLAKKQGLQV
jgi:5-methylcytosine-specific restriction endonuclease McrA